MGRHHTNHKGTEEGCRACAIEEEFDKSRKMERRVLSVATKSTKATKSSEGIMPVPLRRI